MARRVLPLLAVLALLAAACDASKATTTPIDTGTPVDTGGPGDSEAPGTTITIDPNLMAVLPRTVDSIPVIEDSDGDDEIRGNDIIPTFATAAVSAVAADPTTSNLAFGYVVKLKAGAFNDEIYRDWRDTYNAGTCAGETEVVGNASSTVAGNTVYIGTCSNGLLTYHVWLKDRAILISFWSTGEKKLGLVMVANLRK